ncbi:2-hydroxychromene-2-carboxylate isomerase [Ramlibacter sp.]|uniref:2-hydroxychromene-2-carboxylate isomerase n=1 Tax=Ramlibacter sp. TaxID=1917967 RepID=UPI003D10CB6F
MTKAFDFWFDVGSPAAYLAWTQVPAIARETGATVNYKPFLLGGVFQAIGNKSPMEVPAKGRYVLADFERHARHYGVPFKANPNFPISTLMLMRGATGLQMRDADKMIPYVDAVYRAFWAEGRNMSDPTVVGEVLQAVGFDAGEILQLTADAEVKERLKSDTQAAVARGVFGAPTFFVGDDMYWGQDRLDFLRRALQA